MSGDFYGLPTRTLSNDFLRLDYLAEAGPRIVRLFVGDSDTNWLAEAPQAQVQTAYGPYSLRGGHRLWHAPETLARTYVPDDEGLKVEETEQGVRLYQPTEGPTGIAKTVTIELDNGRCALTLHHTLRNDNLWSIELAPWALTQLRLGGTAILPQQTSPLDEDGFWPNRSLVYWPYTNMRDRRLHLDDEYVLVQAIPHSRRFKIGYFNRHGWVAYLWRGGLLVKQFSPQPDQPHVDFNSNCEIYADHRFIELETLAPLTRLEPGQEAVHTEVWTLHNDIDPELDGRDSDAIKAFVKSLNL